MMSLSKLLGALTILVLAIFSTFEAIDAQEVNGTTTAKLRCYQCRADASSGKIRTDTKEKCGGKDWAKATKNQAECSGNTTMCYSAFDKDAKGIARSCLPPELDILFRIKICIENSDALGDRLGKSDIMVCACATDLCNDYKKGGAGGIDLRAGMIFGISSFLLLGSQFWFN